MNEFKNTIKEIKLSSREKRQMQANIIGVASPFEKYFYFYAHPMVRLTASILIVFFVAGGTVSAFAEDTLPGDTLYGVKTQVNEKIAGALAVTPTAKAEHETKLVVRRLKEVEKVLTKDDIEQEDKIEIVTSLTSDITEHRENATEHINEMVEDGDVSEAFTATTELGGALEVHANVISLVANDPEVSELADTVVSQVEVEGDNVDTQKAIILESPTIESAEDFNLTIKNLKGVLRDERESFDKVYGDKISDSDLVSNIKIEAHNEESIARDFEEQARDAEKINDIKLTLSLYSSAIEHYKKANLFLSAAGEFPEISSGTEVEVSPIDPTTVGETATVTEDPNIIIDIDSSGNTDSAFVETVSVDTSIGITDPTQGVSYITTVSTSGSTTVTVEKSFKPLLSF